MVKIIATQKFNADARYEAIQLVEARLDGTRDSLIHTKDNNNIQFFYTGDFKFGSGNTPTGNITQLTVKAPDGAEIYRIEGFTLSLKDAIAGSSPGQSVDLIEAVGKGTVVTMEGSGFADNFRGFSGQDSILGNAGNDTLAGMDGNDTLSGGAGDDSLIGGGGNDLLAGGEGMDVARFAGARNAYTIETAPIGGTTGLRITGPEGTDELTGIERLEFAGGGSPLETAPLLFPPRVSVEPLAVRQAEGAAGSETVFTFRVLRTAEVPGALATETRVAWSVIPGPGSPADANDFVDGRLPAAEVVFGPNVTGPQTIEIRVRGDAVDEPNEAFILMLGTVTGGVLGTAQALATIEDDDTAGVDILATGNGTTVTEGGTTDSLAVRLTSQPTADVRVTFAANPDLDLGAGGNSPQTLTFTPVNWATPQTVTVSAVDDAVAEGQEQATVGVTVTSADSKYSSINPPPQLVTVVDNDKTTVSFTGGPVEINEGNSGVNPATFLSFTLVRTGEINTPLTVDWGVDLAGTVTTADFVTTTGTATFQAGADRTSFTVAVAGDTMPEANEAFQVTLRGLPFDHQFTGGPGQGTIKNDDSATASLSLSPISVTEDGAANLVYTITLSAAQATATTVGYTIGGTSTNGVDYATVTGNVVVPSGQTTTTITIDPTADTAVEPDETVVVTLTAGTGYTVGNPAGLTGTIIDTSTNVIVGTPLDDNLTGIVGKDSISGLAGNDNLVGLAGNDTLDGGAGRDTLDGGDGADLLLGGVEDGTTGASGGSRVLTSVAQAYLTTQGRSLVNTLGSPVSGTGFAQGYGEGVLSRNDDGFTIAINITSIFGPSGLNFFGNRFTSLFVNNNGNITFGQALSVFTPSPIGTNFTNPIIAPFWADVDTSGGVATATPGGTSQGSNLVYFDLDAANGVFTATWDDVGFFASNVSRLNSFQLQLVDRGNGDFDIIFRYEDVNWTTGDVSGGTGGLGGRVARAGYASGTGTSFELPQSGNQEAVLALDSAAASNGAFGATDRIGVYIFNVRNGVIIDGAADSLVGGGGADTLTGGVGADTLTGGTGNDVFRFLDAGDSVFDRSDLIVDFQVGDRIDVAGVTLSGPIGTGSGTNLGLGRIEVQAGSANETLVRIGTDNAPGADLLIRLTGVFTAGQFTIDGGDLILFG